jgi:hypothetical protein
LISNSGGVIKGLTANEDLRLEKEDIKEGYINYENLIWAYVTSDEDMAKYFDEDFEPESLGEYAGIAQQYLFYYERYLQS